MNRVEKAVFQFNRGFSCSQAILSAFAELFNLDYEKALKISQPFGGGIAHRGEICGAVAGALMVIGLKHGRVKAEDVMTRERTYEVVRKFIKKFVSINKSIVCRELLGYDLSQPEQYSIVQEKNLFQTFCSILVRNSAEILENLISD